jgi:diguanylate cyclase (GGDEF)-like protein
MNNKKSGQSTENKENTENNVDTLSGSTRINESEAKGSSDSIIAFGLEEPSSSDQTGLNRQDKPAPEAPAEGMFAPEERRFLPNKSRRGNFKLLFKIVLIFILILVVPMLVSTTLVTMKMEERSEEERVRTLINAAKIARNYINSTKETILIETTRFTENQEFRNLLKSGVKSDVNNFLELELKSRNIDTIRILDLDRNEEAAAYSKSEFSRRSSSEELIDKGIKKIPDASFVIEKCDETNSYCGYIEACAYVEQYGQDLKLIFFLKELPSDFFDKLKDLTNLQMSVLKDNVRVITTAFGEDGKRYVGKTIDKEVITKVQTQGSAVTWEHILSEPFYTIYEKMDLDKPDENIFIGAAVDKTSFLDTNFILVKYLQLITLVSIFLAALAGIFLSYSIVNPIKKLVQGARAIGDGDFDTRIDVTVNDEIGVLADEFNRMGSNLKRSYERLDRKMYEISTLYTVSNSINFQSDSEQILEVIMDKTISALYAERGSIMLLNDDTDELEIKIVRGFKGEVKKRIGLKSGEGIAGKVYERGLGIMVNKGSDDERFKQFQEYIADTKNIQSMICVPLKVKDRAIGVINIVNRVSHGKEFNNDDLNLANALATHAAMAIENAKLYELSITDGMTKLFIHRFFQIRLSEEMVRARRYSSKLSLIMFDIDHFKNFNDTYGHQIGDEVLIGVANILKKAVRQEVDVAARYGGEEFTVIAPETDAPDAFIVSERIRKAIEAAEFPGPDNQILKVKVSLGISTFPTHAEEKMELIRKADTALYFSKENGRNQSTIYRKDMGEVSEK